MRIQVIFGLFIASSFERVVCSQTTIPPECLVEDFKADLEEHLKNVNPDTNCWKVVGLAHDVQRIYEGWFYQVKFANLCQGIDWEKAHDSVTDIRDQAVERLSEIMSKSREWMEAYYGAVALVLEFPSQIGYMDPETLEMNEICKEACNTWHGKVGSAMDLIDITRSDEEFIAEFLTAMRGFQILANRILPLPCLGNPEDTANSTKFVFSTLRKFDEDVKSKRPAEKTWDIHDWVLYITYDAIEILRHQRAIVVADSIAATVEADISSRSELVFNEILSKATKWVDALHDAIDLVFPLEHDQLPLEEEPAKLKMTQKCMDACIQWSAQVTSAMDSMEMTGMDEAFLTKFVTAMSAFRILANKMLPLKCMGNEEDPKNSTKFVYLTLRELNEQMKDKWEDKEMWERMMYPGEAGNALVSVHTPQPYF